MWKKNLGCGVAFLAITFSIQPFWAAESAEKAFSARLLRPDGTPAAGFAVAVAGGVQNATCDADGRFKLDPAPEPPFYLIATGPNGLATSPLEVVSLDATELRLQAELREALTIFAVAPSLDLLPTNAATLLTAEELEQRAPQRLVQTLESVAGSSTTDRSADAVPALRGLARGRTLVLIDGLRVTAERRAGPSATFVDPDSLGSVEVLRGPGSVVYGSDAFGGVINAITRDPEAGRFHVRFNLEAGLDAADEQSGSVGLSFDVLGGQLGIEGYRASANDAEAGDGAPIFNSGFDGRGGALRFVRLVGNGRLRFSFADDRNDDLGKASSDSRLTRSFYPLERSRRFTAAWVGQASESWDALDASLLGATYRLVLDRDRFPTPSARRRIDRSDVESKDVALRLVAGRELGGGRLQVGFDAGTRFDLKALFDRINFAADAATITSVQRTQAIEDARQQSGGLFALFTRGFGSKFSLSVGLRGDAVSVKNTGGFFGDRKASNEALSGNIGLTWAPAPEWSASLQVARGFRNPTLSDRFFRGPSGRGFVVGNPDLEPERALQSDLAVRYTKGRRALALYLYSYEIDQLIERFPVNDNFLFRNRGEARIEGVELEGQFAWSHNFSSEIGLAYSEGEADSDPVADLAPANAWVNLRYTVDRGYIFGRLASSDEKDDPGPSEVARPGFTVFDLGGGWRLTDELELRLLVRNLTDKAFVPSPDEIADRAPGRSVTVGFSGRF
jgi:outer membrane receptor protein involved in Fe transport